MEHVILVDDFDREIGTMEKMEAHHKGILHRAFSVLLFNAKGELLLQKRSIKKYHSGGLWSNTCCSHPLPGEPIQSAVQRKLKQEMGIEPHFTFDYKFFYRAELDSGMIEHECDYVFTGIFDGSPMINPDEAEDWKFISMDELGLDIQRNPQKYTPWFKLILRQPMSSVVNEQ